VYRRFDACRQASRNEALGHLGWYSYLTFFSLSFLARFNWSIVTNMGSAHLKTFGSPEQVAIARCELVRGSPARWYAILNSHDPQIRAMSQKTQARVMYYGLSHPSRNT
jgi:UDP-N-acetylmuramyl pentapeptide synthase